MGVALGCGVSQVTKRWRNNTEEERMWDTKGIISLLQTLDALVSLKASEKETQCRAMIFFLNQKIILLFLLF